MLCAVLTCVGDEAGCHHIRSHLAVCCCQYVAGQVPCEPHVAELGVAIPVCVFGGGGGHKEGTLSRQQLKWLP
jgi:hypothetical protein